MLLARRANIFLINSYILCSCVLSNYILFVLEAKAENNFLKQGIEAYTAGDFTAAAGHLGAAQSAEFNNPKLHYYLANTFVHLNQRDAAIREYRIAFALDPDGEIGKQSKLALMQYETEKKGKNTVKPTVNNNKTTNSQTTNKLSQQDLEELLNSLLGIPTSKQNQSLSQDKNAPAGSKALKESANNLEQLLKDNSTNSTIRLNPTGTNLYVRNYVYTDAKESSSVKNAEHVDKNKKPIKSK